MSNVERVEQESLPKNKRLVKIGRTIMQKYVIDKRYDCRSKSVRASFFILSTLPLALPQIAHAETGEVGRVPNATLPNGVPKNYDLTCSMSEAAHENEPRLAVPSCHGRR